MGVQGGGGGGLEARVQRSGELDYFACACKSVKCKMPHCHAEPQQITAIILYIDDTPQYIQLGCDPSHLLW